jgi:hypothetical protein
MVRGDLRECFVLERLASSYELLIQRLQAFAENNERLHTIMTDCTATIR